MSATAAVMLGLLPKTGIAPLFNGSEIPLRDSALVILLSDIIIANRIRQYFDSEKTESLAHSIRQHGFRGVLWVRQVKGEYHLIAGGRRYAACQLAGIESVPVEVWDITDAEAIQLELLENFQREDLNPIEEAEGVLRMLEVTLSLERSEVITLLRRKLRQSIMLSKTDCENIDVSEPDSASDQVVEAAVFKQIDDVFALIGKYNANSFVNHRLPLLNLPQELIEVINSGQLEYTKARLIARIGDEDARDQVLSQALSADLSQREITDLVKQVQTETHPAVEPPPERRVYDRAQGAIKRLRTAKLGGRELKKVEKLLSQLEELLGAAEA